MAVSPDWVRRLEQLEQEVRSLVGWREDVAPEFRDWEEAWPTVMRLIEEQEIAKRVAVEIAKRDGAAEELRQQTEELRDRRWKPWQRRTAVAVGIVTAAGTIAQTVHALAS